MPHVTHKVESQWQILDELYILPSAWGPDNIVSMVKMLISPQAEGRYWL